MKYDLLRVLFLLLMLACGWWVGTLVDLHDQQTIQHRR